MAVRRPRPGSSRFTDAGSLTVQMEIDPAIRSIVENIGFMRNNALNNITNDAIKIAAEMQKEARLNAPYHTHHGRHPSERYPNPTPAALSIQGQALRFNDNVILALSYPDSVVQRTAGREVTYGGILEAEYHGAYAILRPTFDSFRRAIKTMLTDAAVKNFKGTNKPGEGKGAPKLRPAR